ncbi:MAG: DUF6364 family protein [bacterium]
MQKKLTLRLDEPLIQRARFSAEKVGKSVPQLVADYFALLDKDSPVEESQLTPLVRSLQGALKGAQVDEHDYKRHFEDKYR